MFALCELASFELLRCVHIPTRISHSLFLTRSQHALFVRPKMLCFSCSDFCTNSQKKQNRNLWCLAAEALNIKWMGCIYFCMCADVTGGNFSLYPPEIAMKLIYDAIKAIKIAFNFQSSWPQQKEKTKHSIYLCDIWWWCGECFMCIDAL